MEKSNSGEPGEQQSPAVISNLIAALHHQVERPLGNDPRSAAFAKTMAFLLDKSYAEEFANEDIQLHSIYGKTTMQEIVLDILETRAALAEAPTIDNIMAPSHLANLLLRAVQADQINRYKSGANSQVYVREPRYPEDYAEPQAWLQTIKNIHNDAPRLESFNLIMYCFDLLSNIPQRGAALELGARALQGSGLLGPSPALIDVGCSQNEILTGIALKSERNKPPLYKYRHVGAVRQEIRSSSEVLMPDIPLERYVNRQLAERWLTGLKIGVDMRNAFDPVIANVAEACSFYPTERLDAQRLRTYHALANTRLDDVLFIQGNAAAISLSEMQQRAAEYGITFTRPDIALFSFSLYPHSAETQTAMLNHARSWLGENGWIFVLDFVRPDPNAPNSMAFESDWSASDYLCRLLAIQSGDETRTPHELFVFENGRVERLRLGMAISAIRGAFGHIKNLQFNPNG